MKLRLTGAGSAGVAAAAVWLALSPLTAAQSVTFSDATGAAGIDFTHTTGAFGEKYLPETLGSGAVWIDADGDGWQDLFLVNSSNWPGQGTATPSAFYRNDADGTFSDVTAAAGLDEPIYGIGGAAADYDNDGDVDLYVTALGTNRLYRNRGDGTFEDATAVAGVGDPGFSTSAIWWDYDADGETDLFVANYVEWSVETDLFCTLDGSTKSYCTPESYTGQSGTLYRNRGDGTFEDVTAAAGVSTPTSKGLGVAMLDADADGWMDLFVANDTEPDQLFRNRGDGSFEDIGVIAGVAYSETGVARAGMGVDAADYDDSGLPSLVVGHFSNEMMALFHNEGGLFLDEAPRSALGRATLLTLTFGCFFFDADLDGRLDIFAANGHVADDVERLQSRVTHAQAPQLFHNTGGGRFAEVDGRWRRAGGAGGGAGRGVRRLRSRRRSGHHRHCKRRSRPAAPERSGRRGEPHPPDVARDRRQPERHRGARGSDRGRRDAAARREVGLEATRRRASCRSPSASARLPVPMESVSSGRAAQWMMSVRSRRIGRS